MIHSHFPQLLKMLQHSLIFPYHRLQKNKCLVSMIQTSMILKKNQRLMINKIKLKRRQQNLDGILKRQTTKKQTKRLKIKSKSNLSLHQAQLKIRNVDSIQLQRDFSSILTSNMMEVQVSIRRLIKQATQTLIQRLLQSSQIYQRKMMMSQLIMQERYRQNQKNSRSKRRKRRRQRMLKVRWLLLGTGQDKTLNREILMLLKIDNFSE